MHLNIKSKIADFVAILILVGLNYVLFSFSLPIRSPWFGKLVLEDHHFLTASTIKFTKNWLIEKPEKLYYAMLENPKSIEFKTLEDRLPYVSYPFGTILPIYLTSIFLKHPPDASMVMSFNLINHFLSSLILGLISYIFFRKYKFNIFISLFFSLISMYLGIFLPGPFYIMQNIYFSDQAVMLPILLVIFFELIINLLQNKLKFVVKILQSIIILYGAAIDWFFYFVLSAIFLKRLFIDNQDRLGKKVVNNLYLIVLSLLPILFLIWQIFKLNAFDTLMERFLIRTGLSGSEDSKKNFLETFWWTHYRSFYGEIGFSIFWTSLAIYISIIGTSFLRIRTFLNKNKELLFYISLLLILPLIQIYIFRDHSLVHNFSSLKFFPGLATVPFILLPLLFWALKKTVIDNISFKENAWSIMLITCILTSLQFIFLNKYLPRDYLFSYQQSFYFSLTLLSPLIFFLTLKNKWQIYIISFVSGLISLVYLVNTFPLVYTHFKIENTPIEQIGKSVSQCTANNDIVFSFNLEIPDRPPQLLSASMKRVYKINKISDIELKIKSIKDPFNIMIFYLRKPKFLKYNDFLEKNLYECLGYYYSSFSKSDLEKYLFANNKAGFYSSFDQMDNEKYILEANKSKLYSIFTEKDVEKFLLYYSKLGYYYSFDERDIEKFLMNNQNN